MFHRENLGCNSTSLTSRLRGFTHRQDCGQARCGSWQGSTKQDWQVCHASQHLYLLPVCYWDSRYVASHGHTADTKDRQTYHYHHRGHQGTTFLFQRLSIALQRRNAVSFQNTIITEWSAVAAIFMCLTSIFISTGFVLSGGVGP